MGNRTQRTWWQEMGAISRGLMFLDGSFITPEPLAPPEQRDQATMDATPEPPEVIRLQPASFKRKAMWLLDDLQLLGGRPVKPGRNDDIDEPFPPLHRRHLVRMRTATRARDRSTATCATC